MMARRSGGIGIKLGPVFAWHGGDGPGVGGLIGLLVGAIVAVAVAMILLPLALASFSAWVFSRWSPGGRRIARSLGLEVLLVASGGLALPLAVFVAWFVWLPTFT
jgi:hypothetical protein